NKVDSSLVYLQKASDCFVESKQQTQLISTLIAKNNIHLKRKEYVRAVDFCQKYLKGLDTTSVVNQHESLLRYQMGYAYYKQEEPQAAIPYLLKASQLANASGQLSQHITVQKMLSRSYEAAELPRKALATERLHFVLSDSLKENEHRIAIAKLGAKIESEQLKGHIRSMAFLLCLLVVACLFLLIYYRQKRKHAKIKQQVELDSLRQQSRLRSLNARQDGQEMERKRMAEALHNSMGSLLSALQMNFQALLSEQSNASSSSSKQEAQVFRLIKEAIQTNRGIAHELLPPVLMRFGFKAAIGQLTDKLQLPGLKVSTSVFGEEGRYPEKMELALYRVLDELLNNIIKHAHASEVNIQLTEHDDWINLMVEDNGKGFVYPLAKDAGSLGLHLIQARIHHLGGTMDIDSRLEQGTTVSINLPIDQISQTESPWKQQTFE
ncbi:MAG: sensor histidine kinase, partial [Bacteroidota bacterium]